MTPRDERTKRWVERMLSSVVLTSGGPNVVARIVEQDGERTLWLERSDVPSMAAPR